MGLSYIKIQDLIPKQQKNLADVSYLDLDFFEKITRNSVKSKTYTALYLYF